MKEFIQKNWLVVTAFALPLLFILGVAVSVSLPGIKTEYNFIYASCGNGTNYVYDCNYYLPQKYKIENGKLVIKELDRNADFNGDGIKDQIAMAAIADRIFYHDNATNESREITLEEAQALNLTGLLTAPDGVSVIGNYKNQGGMFFAMHGGSGYGYFLKKGKKASELNLVSFSDQGYYPGNFHFIGWEQK